MKKIKLMVVEDDEDFLYLIKETLKNQFALLVPTIRPTNSGITPQSLLICHLIVEVLSPAELIVFEWMMGKKCLSIPKTKQFLTSIQVSCTNLGCPARAICAIYFRHII